MEEGPKFYMLWKTDDAAEEMRRIHNHIPAPKRALPGHAESYNPPEEYLFNQQEVRIDVILLNKKFFSLIISVITFFCFRKRNGIEKRSQ